MGFRQFCKKAEGGDWGSGEKCSYRVREETAVWKSCIEKELAKLWTGILQTSDVERPPLFPLLHATASLGKMFDTLQHYYYYLKPAFLEHLNPGMVRSLDSLLPGPETRSGWR
jgi:hypothetical protein